MDRPGEAGSWCGNKSSHHHSSVCLKDSQFIATYTHETLDSWSSEVGDRQQLIAFMSDKPINEVMLKRLLEACLVKPTDGIRMEFTSISRNDDQGAGAIPRSALIVRGQFFHAHAAGLQLPSTSTSLRAMLMSSSRGRPCARENRSTSRNSIRWTSL